MSKVIDISPVISERIAVWPGDVPYSRSITCAIEQGANIDLSSVRTTVHLGAHTDAPSHYVSDGERMHERDLSYYMGPCQIIRVDITRGTRVIPSDITVPISCPRVLFHTCSYPDPETWNSDFCSLSPELVHHLADAGVVLVGLDTPSIDPHDSKDLPAHQAVAERDLAILEGVVLDHVDPGIYTLIALPLRLEGADASPVRAVLVAQ